MSNSSKCLRRLFLAAVVASPLALSPLVYGQTGEDPGADRQPPPEREQPAPQPPAQRTPARSSSEFFTMKEVNPYLR